MRGRKLVQINPHEIPSYQIRDWARNSDISVLKLLLSV